MALKLTCCGETHALDIKARRPALVVTVGGRDHRVVDHGMVDGRRLIEIDGRRIGFAEARDGNTVHLRIGGRTWSVGLVDPRDAARDHGGGADEIRAPMPGAVVSVHRRENEAVKRGETVLTIESMKLQTALAAPRDGIIARLLKGEGETFDKDEVVAVMAPEMPVAGQAAE